MNEKSFINVYFLFSKHKFKIICEVFLYGPYGISYESLHAKQSK
jgi:hypothetical protein